MCSFYSENICSDFTQLSSNLSSDFSNRCVFCSINSASNLWESIYVDKGEIHCIASILDIDLSKMHVYTTMLADGTVHCWIKALVNGTFKLGYSPLAGRQPAVMQVTERQYSAGEYILKDTYNFNHSRGERACYCEFVK